MAAQSIVNPPLKWGSCAKKWPRHFWSAFVGGSLAFSVVLSAMFYLHHARKPVFVAGLRLVETEIPQNGILRFYQDARASTRVCPEETRRVVFTPLQQGTGPNGPRRVRVLDDFTSLNATQPEGSIVELPLPVGLQPGEWYYQRYTWFWCGPADYIFGPTYQENAPVKFTIVPQGPPKS
jgi:hypothetical protein